MKRRKIGVMIESFRRGAREGIEKAAEIGADGFQIYVTRGEITPETLDAEARREFLRFVADKGLTISALCADYGQGFLDAERNGPLVESSKRCVDLAVHLGVDIITTHIGKLPDEPGDGRYRACIQAVSELAEYAVQRGVAFATETGPESPEALRDFLVTVHSPGIKVNYDPANFCMAGFDQLGGVKVLADYIIHTHAKDGLRGQPKEVPLGEGDVDLPEWIALLDETGYDGFLTIEREVGDDPVAEIVSAVQYLRGL